MKTALLKQTLTFIIVFGINQIINAQTTITLQPDANNGKDAYIDELTPMTNYGNYQDFAAWTWTFGGNEGTGRSLIDFDLSVLPPNITNTLSQQLKMGNYL